MLSGFFKKVIEVYSRSPEKKGSLFALVLAFIMGILALVLVGPYAF